jgi:hypothetical protein
MLTETQMLIIGSEETQANGLYFCLVNDVLVSPITALNGRMIAELRIGNNVEEMGRTIIESTNAVFHLTGSTEEDYENLSQSSHILAEIRTEHLQNSSQKLSLLIRFPWCKWCYPVVMHMLPHPQ